MLNRQGVSWFDWIKDAGYTTGTIMQLAPERHRVLREAWHDCSDPTEYRDLVAVRIRAKKGLTAEEE